MRLLISAINGFAEVITLLLIARAICSWFARSGNGAYKIYLMLVRLTEPIVAPCRKVTERFQRGMFDFSVLLAFFLVMIVRDLLIRLLLLFA